MIPEFPEFKKLELSDKKDVEGFTSKFPPYSDFNFFNMWCWDVHHKMKVSQLNKNLVVLFSDYICGDNFLSFLGNNKVMETTSKLISFSETKFHKNFLKLVPEDVFLNFKLSNFIVSFDRNSFDYVYLVEHLANMKNWTQNTCGKRIRNFIKTQPNYIVKHSLISEISHGEHKEMFQKWAKTKKINNHIELNEYKAFERILKISDKNLRLVSIYKDQVIIGFTVYEIVSKDYAISHFAKADKEYNSAIYDLLNWEEAKYLHTIGIKYFNWEQDLEISGLRYAKIKYKPAFFFKKLIIKSNTEQIILLDK